MDPSIDTDSVFFGISYPSFLEFFDGETGIFFHVQLPPCLALDGIPVAELEGGVEQARQSGKPR